MELIYVYIDKYRTFEKQKISFSKKFSVDYDNNNENLLIRENKPYFNIYPANIVNISGIFGKNATGKSSLLTLIGNKIDDRHRTNEIYVEDENNPHKKISLFSINKSEQLSIDDIKYASSYFLLYFIGKDKSDRPLFVFETNTPLKYIRVFDNSAQWTEKKETYSIGLDYYLEKGWFSVIFRIENQKNVLLNNTQNFPEKNSIQNNVNIICFEKNYYKNKFDVVHINDTEGRIAIPRRTVPMQTVLYKSQINFLVEQMKLNSEKRQIYNSEKYELVLEFASITPSSISADLKLDFYINEVIDDYRDFEIDELKEWQKITLAFLNQYTWYILTIAEDSNKIPISGKKDVLIQLNNMRSSSAALSFIEIKELYYEKIEYIFREIANESITLSELKKCENALENFLKNSKKFGFSYTYKTGYKLIIEINSKSNVAAVDSFFDNFIDENMNKNMQGEDSVMHGFLSVDINWMSDGEKENLALFTSIDEQITFYPSKDKYILLFDEIERSIHPDMCRCLVSELITFLSKYPNKEFQIIIASHSPFIASDLLQENIVCLSREGGRSIVNIGFEKPFAQNIYTLLKSQFFLNSFLGEYAIDCIKLIMECSEIEKIEEVQQKINGFLNNTDKNVLSTEEIAGFIGYVINSIGEPLISNELSRRLLNRGWYSTNEKIQYYKNKIAELEELLNDKNTSS